MKSNGNLQKHYDTFSPRERLALIFAAIARKDDAERLALIDSAPTKIYRMADYHGEAGAFNLVCLYYIAKQLDLSYLQSTLAHWEPRGSKKQEKTAERYYKACCMSAYVFCLYADAWRAFCEGLGIDAEAALKGLPGAQSLEMAESLSRGIAYTRAEAQAAFEQNAAGLELRGELITVESVTQQIRATFERWAEML